MATEDSKSQRLPAWASGLEGRVALLTGASRGIGRACALALAAAGADVIAVARQQADLDVLMKEGNARIQAWSADVTSDAFLERVEALPALDILFTNAGMNRPLPIEDVDTATLDQMLALNVRAVYRAAQSAARVMIKVGRGGSIIHMSSQMGHVGAARRTVYCMTKHAIEGLTKAMAVELAPHGIRVNSIAPTFIETELTRPMLDDPAFRRAVLESIPMGRIGQPEDVVGAVLFLASPASSLVTGDSLRIDGGWTAR
jgi:NAD(P)-dependent dehydrogenase (short-subunit alcohol dehydrogenase family)